MRPRAQPRLAGEQGGAAAAIASRIAGSAKVEAGGHGVGLEGKTVEFVIPFSESGGTARWANFCAALLS